MPLTRAQIEYELWPGLDDVMGAYETYPDEWKQIYNVKTSKKAYEKISQPKLLGYAQPVAEGEQIPTDDGMGDQYITQFTHRKYGLKFSITEEAQDDNLYKSEFPQNTLALKQSLSTTKNTLAGLYLTNGFAGGTSIVSDGLTLFNTAHPYDGGVNSNVVSGDLSEATLNAAQILAANLRSASGIPIAGTLRKLIVGPENWFAAKKLTESQFEPSSANNAINAAKGLLPEGFVMNHFISSVPNSRPWFILTNLPGMRLYQRMNVLYNIAQDPDNFNIKVSARERYSLGCYDYRSIIGCQG